MEQRSILKKTQQKYNELTATRKLTEAESEIVFKLALKRTNTDPSMPMGTTDRWVGRCGPSKTRRAAAAGWSWPAIWATSWKSRYTFAEMFSSEVDANYEFFSNAHVHVHVPEVTQQRETTYFWDFEGILHGFFGDFKKISEGFWDSWGFLWDFWNFLDSCWTTNPRFNWPSTFFSEGNTCRKKLSVHFCISCNP